MKHGALERETRSTGLHFGRRLGDVQLTKAADEELAWFFNGAVRAIEAPSVQGVLFDGGDPGDPAAVEARAEALHAARKIWERLCVLGAPETRILEALYTERRWPRALERSLGYLAGVVEALPGVRAAHLRERAQGSTAAANATAWLEEKAAERPEELRAWKQEALRACVRALSAYQKVRGTGRSVVPKEDR
jgi:hypothetical protein